MPAILYSYILNSIAKELNLKSAGCENVANHLFGGVVSPMKQFNMYNILIKDRKEKFSLALDVWGENSLCPLVACVDLDSMSKFSYIELSDIHNDLPISLVIGGDVYGQLLTGEIIQRGTLTAINTKLG